MNLMGSVTRVDGNKITIFPKHEDLKDELEFLAHELKKYFNQGDHVKVIAGRYEGDTGLIVRVEENMIVLFSDLTMHELKVVYMTFIFTYDYVCYMHVVVNQLCFNKFLKQ